MKVLLVHPSIREWAPPSSLPLGLLYTAAALKRDGVPYRIHDDNWFRGTDEQLLRDLQVHFSKLGCGLVGISAMASQYGQVERWVRLIRQVKPFAPIVVGGPISVLGEKLMKWLDVSVWQGESEEEFPDAVKNLDFSLSRVYRAGPISQETLDDLLPDWEGFDSALMNTYAENPVGFVNRRKWIDGKGDPETPRSMNVLMSRGCPKRCAFCARNFIDQGHRVRSVDSVISEMLRLHREYGIKYLHSSSDNDTANHEWLLEFCAEFKRHLLPLGCSWGGASRVDTIDRETLQAMKDSGSLGVGLGIETGSQRVLDIYRKGVSVAQQEAALVACKEVFGAADFSLIVGAPGEDDQSIAETIELCRRTNTKPAICFWLTPIPGSTVYANAVRDGLIKDEEAYLLSLGENSRQIACNVSGQSDQWLMDAKRDLEEATKGFGS